MKLIRKLGLTRLKRSESWDENVELIRKLGQKCGIDQEIRTDEIKTIRKMGRKCGRIYQKIETKMWN